MKAVRVAAFLLLLIPGWFIWLRLPPAINRRSDIRFGNKRIAALERYQKQYGRLPETTDWQTLRQLGFEDKGDLLVPDYQKLSDTAFELVYVKGFDGPYLLWNTMGRR